MTARLRPLAGLVILLIIGWILTAHAHQDPCHRCPSDRGTYVCGDRGRCDQCPDNAYCLNRKPRAATGPSATPGTPVPMTPQTVTVTRVIDGDTL